jgi:hypothetical protein
LFKHRPTCTVGTDLPHTNCRCGRGWPCSERPADPPPVRLGHALGIAVLLGIATAATPYVASWAGIPPWVGVLLVPALVGVALRWHGRRG